MTYNDTCPRLAGNRADCPCPNRDCIYFGRCCDCVAAHRENGRLTTCMEELLKKRKDD